MTLLYLEVIVFLYLCRRNQAKMKEHKPYLYTTDKEPAIPVAQEPVAAYACETTVMPDDVAYARIVDGVLQVTPDIEEEIAAVDRGETVSLGEFKKMFAQWL